MLQKTLSARVKNRWNLKIMVPKNVFSLVSVGRYELITLV